jgi:hypothetical protein
MWMLKAVLQFRLHIVYKYVLWNFEFLNFSLLQFKLIVDSANKQYGGAPHGAITSVSGKINL